MMNQFKKYSVLVLVIMSAALSGCATMEGFGEDVESAGEEIQDASND